MFASTRGRGATALLAVVWLLGACASDDAGLREDAELFDACTLISTEEARAHLGKSPTKESYQSGIGPGCVYRAGIDKRIGLNLQSDTFDQETWLQQQVQPAAGLQPTSEKARLEEVDGPGDANYWLSGKTVRVLYVWEEGRAFDIYLSLGRKVSLKAHLAIARELATEVVERLLTAETPSADNSSVEPPQPSG